MKTKTQNLLPKTMPGTVHTQFVRCGKSNCKCAQGELHGAYYYHFVRVDGKLRKRYLKKVEVEEALKACVLRQSEEKEQRLRSDKIWKQLREMRANLREYQNLYNK